MNPLINHGPWLTNPDIGKITIGFSSADPCAAAVEYRTGSSPWHKIYQSEGGQIVRAERRHIFHLSGLIPGAEYEFRAVVFNPDTDEENSAAGKFTVFDPARKNNSFLVLADLQFSREKRLELLNKYHALSAAGQCDFTVLLGDMLWSIDDFEKDALGGIIDLLKQTGFLGKPVLLVRGNHELRGKANWEWTRWFGSPEGRPYTMFRQGDAAFLMLDSWSDQPCSNQAFRMNLDREFLSAEKVFVKHAVEQEIFQSAKYKIVMAHGASHSHIDQFRFLNPNMHNLTDEFFMGSNPSIQIHAWICGHIHHYIRTVPGKAECASISCPPQPVSTPENYTFPVLTTDGPDVIPEIVPPSGIQSSAFLIRVTENELDIQALSEERGGLIDRFAILPDRRIVEKMAIPHYKWNSDANSPFQPTTWR